MPTTTTELEAVNTMLRYTGESPVNVITGTGLPVHVTIAVAVLADISREVQLEGWHFNTAPKVTLSPDGSTKKIAIATDIVKIDANDKTKDVVVRGAFLYDRKDATFEFNSIKGHGDAFAIDELNKYCIGKVNEINIHEYLTKNFSNP